MLLVAELPLVEVSVALLADVLCELAVVAPIGESVPVTLLLAVTPVVDVAVLYAADVLLDESLALVLNALLV